MTIVIESIPMFWGVTGTLAIILEIMLLGMGSGVFLFAGFGALITAAALLLGFIPELFGISLVVFCTASSGSALALRPLMELLKQPLEG